MDAKLIDRLRKILALTTSPVEGEAAAATHRLQVMLTEHNLSIADLEQKGAPAARVTEGGHDLGKAAFKWKLNLADAIAGHFFCVSLTDHDRKVVKFAGRPDNVESLQMLYAWVIEQIKGISAAARKEHEERTGEHIDPLRWQVQFGIGAVSRLAERLQQIARDRERDAKQATGGDVVTALVLRHDKEANDYLEEKYGYRKDGLQTKAQREREEMWARERAADAALLASDPDAYYDKYPWLTPLTPEEQAAKDKADAAYWRKVEAQERRNARRRTGRAYREPSEAQQRAHAQGRTAKESGKRNADKVNLTPFITGKGPAKEIR